MTVTCNVPQKYSEIASSIQKIENNREVLAHRFQVIRRVPEIKSSNLVVIEGDSGKYMAADCSIGAQ
jgi:hypothetical protein